VTPIYNNPLKRTRELEIVPFRNKKVCYENENLDPDPHGFQGALLPILDIIDLLHFRSVNLTFKHMVELELVQRINRGEITFRDIGLKTVTQVLHFFTYHTENIIHLDLKELVVSDSDLELIRDNFPKLQSLHLNKTYVFNTDIFTEMKSLKTLELIECSCTLGHFDMSFVTHCQLEVLILNGTKLRTLRFLQFAQSLIKLEISICYHDPNEFSHLKYCTSLKDLSLINTNFCDPSSLKELPLERFILKNTQLPITLYPMMDFKFIENFTNLKILTIQHINTLSILAGCKSLCELEFSSVALIDLTPLTNLPIKKLTIKGQYPNLEELSKLTSLTHLDASETNFDDDDFDSISKLPLETLVIDICESLAFLKNFTKLTKLIVHETHSADINDLVHLPLEHLQLGECYEPKNYSSLGKLKQLKTLIIKKADSIKDLCFLEQLVDLEVLSIEGSRCIGNFEDISHCKKLKDLNLARTNVPYLSFIKNLKFLNNLNISETFHIEDIRSIVNCNMLSTIIYANKTKHIIDIKNQIETIHKEYYQSVYEDSAPESFLNLFQGGEDDLDRIQLAAMNGIEEAISHLDRFREDIRLFQLSQYPKHPNHLGTLAYCYVNGIAVDENLSMALLNYYLASAMDRSAENFNSFLQDVYTLAEEGDSECQSLLQFCYEHGMIQEMPNIEGTFGHSEGVSNEIEEIFSDSDEISSDIIEEILSDSDM